MQLLEVMQIYICTLPYFYTDSRETKEGKTVVVFHSNKPHVEPTMLLAQPPFLTAADIARDEMIAKGIPTLVSAPKAVTTQEVSTAAGKLAE